MYTGVKVKHMIRRQDICAKQTSRYSLIINDYNDEI